MATVTGNVSKKIANKFAAATGGETIIVNGKYYNSNYPIKAEAGDQVEFNDGTGKQCRELRVVGKTVGDPPAAVGGGGGARSGGGWKGVFPIPANDGQRSIIRQNSVTNAVHIVEIMVSQKISKLGEADILPEVLRIAHELEKYSSGDLDTEVLAELEKEFDVK